MINDNFGSFLLGAGLTSILFGFVLLFVPNSSKEVSEAIHACEKDLPRSQRCVIIAVPETKK